ncbi:choice-of-anchor B family protein [Saccharophagus degradans]|uniref:choice-of-anchor B family protein n=1 Tax=Saccharophagus degradans TaxID=86304 RepID=UPI003A80387D
MERLRLQTFLQPIALVASFATITVIPNAYADSGIARYVAADGQDESDCTNLFRPCQSVIYAISQSTKTDRVYVAAGDYQINSTDDVFTITANSYRLYGGYSRVTQFNASTPEENTTTLIGIPAQQRTLFAERGFRVVSDLKHMRPAERANTQALSKTLSATMQSHSKADCVNNSSNNFPCENINLLSHVGFNDLPLNASGGSDIWGFVDLNTQREYSIIGLDTGVAVVDITDGENPFVVGSDDGLRNDWRDIKIYQHYDTNTARWQTYAYVTTEANQGLVVIDMTGLPNSVTSVSYASDITSAHNVYIAGVDYTFGAPLKSNVPASLTIAGATNGGVNRVYSLTTPTAPSLVGTAGSGYMHDGSSVLISDARKNTDCVNALQAENCVVYADFNEDAIVILDLTNPADPEVISTITYSNSEYVHSGWWSEDAQTLFVHDELDEFYTGAQTQVRAFNMSNLRSPVPAGNWQSNNRTIDHNGFVRGNRYYMSNYTAGLTVLDITNPQSITRTGYFDTVPASDSTQFSGAWGAYPFYPSGKIAISDINSGLYLLQDKTLASTAGEFTFSTQQYSGEEGNTVEINVERLNSSTGAATVQLELQHLTTTTSDISLDNTSLSWSDGETASKSVTLTITTDGADESVESAAIWLKNPQGGATLTNGGLAYIQVADSSSTNTIQLMANQSAPAANNQPFMFVAQRLGGISGAVSVNYEVSLTVNSASTAVANGTIEWADGEAANKVVSVPASALTELSNASSLDINLQNAINTQLANATVSIQLQDQPTTPTIPTTPSTPSEPSNNSSGGGGNIPGYIFIALTALLLCRKKRGV